MRVISAAILAITLFVPRSAGASEILFRISDGGDLAFDFGQEPFQLSGFFDEVAIDGVPCCGAIQGSVDMISGPLLNLTVSPDTFDCGTGTPCYYSYYTYGAGTVSIDAQFDAPDGAVATGSFAATLLGFTISVCEGCDLLFGGSLANDVVIALGPGLFDPAFSSFLGITGPSSGGVFVIGPEAITGDPSSTIRRGFSHSGSADLLVTADRTVPEPGTTALAVAAGAIVLARRHRVRPSARS